VPDNYPVPSVRLARKAQLVKGGYNLAACAAGDLALIIFRSVD
jgi:hypothetical protein